MTAVLYAIGLMSGTSIDGSVSAALIATDGEYAVRRIAAVEHEYESPTGLRAFHHLAKAAEVAYREAFGNEKKVARRYPQAKRAYVAKTFDIGGKQVDEKLTQLESEFRIVFGGSGAVSLKDIIEASAVTHAEAVAKLLARHPLSEPFVIGYHGQTLYHAPFDHVTVQVGNPKLLAERFAMPVVFNFRSNDITHGGQGAPIAPAYHRALAAALGLLPVAILNLGGTANVTFLNDEEGDPLAFDTGPANGLIDRFVKEKLGLAYDRDSAVAMRGKVHEEVVHHLINHAIILKDERNYLDIPPPKSLDIRDYTYEFPKFEALTVADACATLNAFTAACVAKAIDWLDAAKRKAPTTWVLCGGGTHSVHLREQLQERLSARIGNGCTIKSADEVGWSAAAMEAEVMAYLAVRVQKQLPITFPLTTGVRLPLCGGEIVMPRTARKRSVAARTIGKSG